MPVGMLENGGPAHRLTGVLIKVARYPPFQVAELRSIDPLDCDGIWVGRIVRVKLQMQKFHRFAFLDDRWPATAIRVLKGRSCNLSIEVFIGMGYYMLCKRCVKRFTATILTDDRVRRIFRPVGFCQVFRRRLTSHRKVDCKGEE